jgi:hypothetical protein
MIYDFGFSFLSHLYHPYGSPLYAIRALELEFSLGYHHTTHVCSVNSQEGFFWIFFGRANCNWVRMDFRIWTGSIKKYLLAMACIFSAFVFCFCFCLSLWRWDEWQEIDFRYEAGWWDKVYIYGKL